MDQVAMQQQQIQQLAQQIAGGAQDGPGPLRGAQLPQQSAPIQPLTPPITGGVPSDLNSGQQPSPIQ